MSYNKAEIIGRIGQDIEVNHTGSGTPVANMSVATSNKYKDKSGELQEETTWHDCVLWDRKAEIAEKYLSKGDQVHVSGPIQKSKWEDKNGNNRTSTEIKVLTLTMLGSGSNNGAPKQQAKQGPQNDTSNMDEVEDPLPF